jgi:hypothetical protein
VGQVARAERQLQRETIAIWDRAIVHLNINNFVRYNYLFQGDNREKPLQ